jgi:hypothetical protein
MSKYRRLKSKHRCSANIDVYRPSLDKSDNEKPLALILCSDAVRIMWNLMKKEKKARRTL